MKRVIIPFLLLVTTAVFTQEIRPFREAHDQPDLIRSSGGSRDTLRLSLVDPLYPTRPAKTHVITLERDEHGFPARYSFHLVAATCFDGKCKPLDVTLHWDAIGRYDGLEVAPGRPLNRKEHEPFTEADYRRLNEILRDPYSLLGKHPLEFFVPSSQADLDALGVDGVSGATPVERRGAVVPGAAYSSWVLWHWVHGEIVDQLLTRARARPGDDFLLHGLNSGDPGFVAFALDELPKRDALTPVFEQACYRVLEDSGRANCERALRALTAAPSDPASLHRQIIRRFGRNGGSSRLILAHLEKLPDASPVLWEKLAIQLSSVTDYRDLKGALELLSRRAATSQPVRRQIEKLTRHADRFVAMQAEEFLEQGKKKESLRERPVATSAKAAPESQELWRHLVSTSGAMELRGITATFDDSGAHRVLKLNISKLNVALGETPDPKRGTGWISIPPPATGWNLEHVKRIQANVTNTGSKPADTTLWVMSSHGWAAVGGTAALKPDQQAALSCDLRETYPDGTPKIDPARIREIRIMVQRADSASVKVSGLVATGTAEEWVRPAGRIDVPDMAVGKPAPGRRVRYQLAGDADNNIYCVLYLPPDWEPGKRYPVIAEYPGKFDIVVPFDTSRFGRDGVNVLGSIQLARFESRRSRADTCYSKSRSGNVA